jgi:glycosyltransferase involved in cell wall biosynthesis
MPYGMDEQQFHSNAVLPNGLSAMGLRQQLGFAADAIVVGHVGRFMPQKNHAYLLRTAAEALTLQPKLHFLLIGDGPLRADMETLARQLGIDSRVTFAGHRLDIPLLMRHAMDCFFFPSLWEGLGIVLLEAQVAGLPCLLSNRIPPEANVFPDRNRHLAVDVSPHRAARELVSFLDARRGDHFPCGPTLPTGYQIQHNARLLAAIYRDSSSGQSWRERAGRHEQPA